MRLQHLLEEKIENKKKALPMPPPPAGISPYANAAEREALDPSMTSLLKKKAMASSDDRRMRGESALPFSPNLEVAIK